jgi:hypothetical protein
MAREEFRVAGGSNGAIRHRRKLRALADKRQRHDVNIAEIVSRRQDFDVGNAGNRDRRANGDEESIRAGEAFEEYVGAADMRECRCLKDQRDQQSN